MSKQLTQEQLIKKLEEDPLHFIEIFLKRKLSFKQKAFLISTKTSNHCVAIWSRQTGKSTIIASYIVWRLLYGKGEDINGEHIDEHVVILAPIKDQVDNLYVKIENLIMKNDYISKYIITMNKTKIVAKNGNQLSFKSASPGSQIRGATATCIIIDETQDISDSKYYADILPFGATTNALIIEAGTPKTKNHFWTTINSPTVVVTKQLWHECPFLSEKYVMDQKRNSPAALWRQEYLCEFIETGVLAFPSGYFVEGETVIDYPYLTDVRQLTEGRKEHIQKLLDEGAIFYAGNDVGRQNDNSVFCIWRVDIRPVKLMMCIVYPLGKQLTEIAKELAFINNIYSLAEYNLDYTNEKSYVEILRDKGLAVVLNSENKRGGIVFTAKNKTEMVNNAQMLLEQRQIIFPSAADSMLQQFMNQQFEIIGERYKYYHPSNEHDDIMWACLLALKNVRLAERADKLTFVNPWEKFDEHTKGETGDVKEQLATNATRYRSEARKTKGILVRSGPYTSGARSLQGRY